MKKKRIAASISVDPDVYAEASEVAAGLGLSMSGAIELFLRAFVRERGLPFEVRLAPSGTDGKPADGRE